MWIIEGGLTPGERVVVEGIQQIKPDLVVNAQPFVAPSPGPTPTTGISP
jgi:membrane fusion protein (multidrug efflux system)